MTTPSHLSIARLEHAIVVNRRRYYCLHESGQLDRAEQARLELDYLNLCYWKHHYGQHVQDCDASQHKVRKGVDSLRDNDSPAGSYTHHIPSFKDWIHEPVVDTSRNNGIFYDEERSL